MTPLLAHAGGTDETLSLVMLFAGLWVGWIGWSRLRGTGFDRMPRAAAWGLIAGAVALVAAASFVPRALLGPKNVTAVTGPRPRSTATLAFAEPQPDVSTSADQMTVRLDLRGGTITAVTSTSVAPDTGHIHLSLDGALVSMLGDTVQVVDLRALPPGPHTLTAEFVAADHLPFDPPVTTTVSFVKEQG
jgi:hypothetical protein